MPEGTHFIQAEMSHSDLHDLVAHDSASLFSYELASITGVEVEFFVFANMSAQYDSTQRFDHYVLVQVASNEPRNEFPVLTFTGGTTAQNYRAALNYCVSEATWQVEAALG